MPNNKNILREKINELSTEYALLKGLKTKNFEDLKRLRELETFLENN